MYADALCVLADYEAMGLRCDLITEVVELTRYMISASFGGEERGGLLKKNNRERKVICIPEPREVNKSKEQVVVTFFTSMSLPWPRYTSDTISHLHVSQSDKINNQFILFLYSFLRVKTLLEHCDTIDYCLPSIHQNNFKEEN